MNDDNQSAPLEGQGSQDFGNSLGTPAPQQGQQGGQGQQTQQGQPAQQGQQSQQGQQGQGQGTQVSQAAATSQQQQSQADIIKATVDATAQAMMRQQQSQQQIQQQARGSADLSPDEFNKKFQVVQITPEHVTALLDQDPKKGAAVLNNLIQGAVRQAVLMSQEIATGRISEVTEKYEPHIQSWQSYQQQVAAQQAEERFFKSHPDLAGERELVFEMKDAFLAKKASGQINFSNEKEAFDAVANATRTILKRVNPQWRPAGQAGGGGATGAAGQPQGRQMSAASSAGHTGTGQAAAKNVVDEIFGADAR